MRTGPNAGGAKCHGETKSRVFFTPRKAPGSVCKSRQMPCMVKKMYAVGDVIVTGCKRDGFLVHHVRRKTLIKLLRLLMPGVGVLSAGIGGGAKFLLNLDSIGSDFLLFMLPWSFTVAGSVTPFSLMATPESSGPSVGIDKERTALADCSVLELLRDSCMLLFAFETTDFREALVMARFT